MTRSSLITAWGVVIALVSIYGCSNDTKWGGDWGLLDEMKPVITASPILSPTSESVSLITPELKPAPLTDPLDFKFDAEDGQILDGRYYPPAACPAPLILVYFPWAQGDLNDWEKIQPYFPGKFPYAVFSITPRGCEGGCQTWDRQGWLLDFKAAVQTAERLPCADDRPLMTLGSALGGDAAFFACGVSENCFGAVAFSPGGWLGIAYEDEVKNLIEQGKYAWSIYAQDDAKAISLYRPDWLRRYREIVVEGKENGNHLFNSYTIGILLQILRDVTECAAFPELSCPLSEVSP